MKAAVMYGPSDIRIEEVERPACPEGGFVLKVLAIGLCGSDIRNLTTDSRKGDYPFIYGHEIVGTVDEVSETCTKYKVGDALYVYPVDHCMTCEPCRTGHSEMCENGGDYTIGCFHAKLAKLRDAKKVIMIEINDNRLNQTLQFGVDHIINSTKIDPIKEVKKLTDGKGADKVISANPSTAAQAQAIFMAKKNGIVVFFGGVAKGALTELDTNYTR